MADKTKDNNGNFAGSPLVEDDFKRFQDVSSQNKKLRSVLNKHDGPSVSRVVPAGSPAGITDIPDRLRYRTISWKIRNKRDARRFDKELAEVINSSRHIGESWRQWLFEKEIVKTLFGSYLHIVISFSQPDEERLNQDLWRAKLARDITADEERKEATDG